MLENDQERDMADMLGEITPLSVTNNDVSDLGEPENKMDGDGLSHIEDELDRKGNESALDLEESQSEGVSDELEDLDPDNVLEELNATLELRPTDLLRHDSSICEQK